MSKEFNPGSAMADAMDEGDLREFCRLGELYPHERDDPKNREYWFFAAAKKPHIQFMELFLKEGMDVNMRESTKPHDTVISDAVMFKQLEMARFLLARGADPNVGRPIITAIGIKDEALALEFVKLLVEHGANVNELFDFYGDRDHPFTALDWASRKPAIAAYLKSHGAKTSDELLGKSASPKKEKPAGGSLSERIVAYFEEHFGPVDQRSLVEIVPTEPPISVHVVPPSPERRGHVTLFTTGMSAMPMTVPPGEEEWQYAELFIQLPGDWKFKDLGDPNFGWPIHRLRSLAKYPHQLGTWLGGPVTIISNDDPPQPLAPNVRFDSLLLLAEHRLAAEDGRIINIYRMSPLYPEERALEARSGIAALMQAFDRHSIPFIVDLKRKNVAT